MNDATQFLIVHGVPIVFGAVLIDQMGIPIPALPWLLAAGALVPTGRFHWLMAFQFAVLACLIGDFFWFYLGRYRGTQVLGFLCRMSLEPDSCVRRTVNVFTRYGWPGVMVAKFIPGMSTVIPPLAGMSRMNPGQFLLIDGAGSVLYCGTVMLVGFLFSNQIAQIAATLTHIGGNVLTVVLISFILYIAYKYWQRQRLLWELRTAKITVNELGKMLDAGENPLILDMRSVLELEQDPGIIQGAIHVAMEDLEKRRSEFPHDREIVVYCDCPNEESSSKTALLLRRKGFTRVRPLLGGIEAWRKGNHPMSVWTKTTKVATTTVLLSQEPESKHSAPHDKHAAK